MRNSYCHSRPMGRKELWGTAAKRRFVFVFSLAMAAGLASASATLMPSAQAASGSNIEFLSASTARLRPQASSTAAAYRAGLTSFFRNPSRSRRCFQHRWRRRKGQETRGPVRPRPSFRHHGLERRPHKLTASVTDVDGDVTIPQGQLPRQ